MIKHTPKTKAPVQRTSNSGISQSIIPPIYATLSRKSGQARASPANADSASTKNYPALINDIGSILSTSRQQAYKAVNSALVQAYWKIGQRIVEYEQGGKEKAEYGEQLLGRLQHDLTRRYGRGFSATNIAHMRLLYIQFPIMETLSPQLS